MQVEFDAKELGIPVGSVLSQIKYQEPSLVLSEFVPFVES